MKKVILAAFIAATALSQAQADDSATGGTIKFEGKVVADTCTIKGSDLYEQTVTLPTVTTSQFTQIGDDANSVTPFSIELTGCTSNAEAQVYAKFINPASSTVNSDGRLNNEGSATSVDVVIMNSTGASINLNDNSNANNAAVDLSGTDVTLNYQAKYYATAASVGAGSVTTSVEFELAYQ